MWTTTTRWTLPLSMVLALGGAGCSADTAPPPSPPAASAGNSSAGSTAAAGSSSAGSTGVSGAGGLGGAATGGSSGAAGSSGTGGSSGTAGSSGTGGSGGATGMPSTEPFSFFVASLAALQQLSGSDIGFGGDLSYGEVGPGAGLRGADKICTAIAEMSMPGNNKTWRAFLSVTADENGEAVNAIDRIGPGPWYDRIGRLVSNDIAGLQQVRPAGDAAISSDLPNEDGVPNHQPDPTTDEVDNHDTLTGSDDMGMLVTDNAAETCNDWTNAVGEEGVTPQIGHSWPREGGGDQSWIAEHNAGGCGPGVNLFGSGGPQPGDYTVGAGGGYGGFYCFSLNP